MTLRIGNSDATLKDLHQDSFQDSFINIQQQELFAAAAFDQKLMNTLDDLSIQEPIRSQLLATKNLTDTIVQAWFLYAETQPGLIDPRGYAIKRLLVQDPPPRDFAILAKLGSEMWQTFAMLADKLTTGQLFEEEITPEVQETFIIWARIYADLEPKRPGDSWIDIALKL